MSAPKLIDMETLRQQQEENVDDEINRSAQEKTKSISFPGEIIQDILSRLPVKSVLRFRSVSKHWLSLLSHDPCFPELHFNRSVATEDRTSFFISAFDPSTNERHFLSAPIDGGPVTHLITLHDVPRNSEHQREASEAEHLNGLVLFTSRNSLFRNFAFVVNPATRKVFKVPPPYNNKHCTYFFGFDESNSEHKILSVCCTRRTDTIEFIIFSLSTYYWRHIPVYLKELPPVSDVIHYIRYSVCVNSVIHLMVHHARYEIFAFDLRTEKLSIINLPRDAIPRKFMSDFTRLGKDILKINMPFLIKDNELLGVVCHDVMVETNEMHIWILQDYVNRVWVRETVTPSESWIDLDVLETTSFLHMADLVFNCRRLSRDMVNAFILDRKSKSFKLVNFHLGYEFLHSETLKFRQVRSYVESMLPLREE